MGPGGPQVLGRVGMSRIQVRLGSVGMDRIPVLGGVGMRRFQILGGDSGMSRIRILLLIALLSLQSFGVLSQSRTLITDPSETQVLLAFRKALIDPKNNLATWLATTDPCENWSGVYCATSAANSTYRHVTELQLFNFNLGGMLVPELGNLPYMTNLDVMWNQLTGDIPKELGQLSNLKILTLSGNNLNGTIPPELGNLATMLRIQLDENSLRGPVPTTFGNLTSLAHLHLNNNSLNGTVPKELGQCPNLIHILLDNNKLTGSLPPEISNASNLAIIQLDNNSFSGGIPPDYTAKLHFLTKLSCRNCGLTGPIPDMSTSEHLYVLDLSYNNLNGTMPNFSTKNLTTVDLSNNQLLGPLPSSLNEATILQSLVVRNNNLNDSIPDFTQSFLPGDQIVLDFQNNSFQYVSLGMVTEAATYSNQIDLRLYGNVDICTSRSQSIPQIETLCQPVLSTKFQSQGNINYLPRGGPIVVLYRLKSPSFTYFTAAYEQEFTQYLAAGLFLQAEQVSVNSFEWQPGPRLLMTVLIEPTRNSQFNKSEVSGIKSMLSNWNVGNSSLFGPYELLGFYFLGRNSKLSAGAIAGIVIGSVVALCLLILLALCVMHKKGKKLSPGAKRRTQMQLMRASQHNLLKVSGVVAFTYKELARATEDFSESKEVGRGGYGKVYRGVLESGQVVAIKRASLEAIQRNTEFYNEIELLSRCHHRNLVALVGYCNDEEEQMLVYEFMEGGTLQERLRKDAKNHLNFITRLKIALGSAKGILYLHTEADPPIFHRDIKSNNILLDLKNQAKVADFGLSRLAPDFQDEISDTQSHVSTVVKGTPGYLDPEYFLTRKLTDKSDVYSFGVVLLELITGMQAISYGKNIVREVKASREVNGTWKVIDQNMGSYTPEVIDPFLTLAMSCVEADTDARPTMKEVTRTLEGLLMSAAKGKPQELTDLSLDITKDDFSMQQKQEKILDNNSIAGPDSTGFDTGISSASSTGSTKLFTPFYSRFYRLDAADNPR